MMAFGSFTAKRATPRPLQAKRANTVIRENRRAPRLQEKAARPIQENRAPSVFSEQVATPASTSIGAGQGGAWGTGPDVIGPFAAGSSNVPAADPVVEEPVLPGYGSDATYISQMAQLAQALADKKAEDQLQRSQYGQNYNDSLRMMGWSGDPTTGNWDPTNKQGYYGQAYGNTWDDFAARGMLQSGSFADALSQLLADYGQRKTGLDTSKAQYLSGLTQDLNTYTNQNTAAGADAKIQAIARIAQMYGVDPSVVKQ